MKFLSMKSLLLKYVASLFAVIFLFFFTSYYMQAQAATSKCECIKTNPSLPCLDPGVYVMVRSRQLLNDTVSMDELVSILKRDWVKGLAVGFHLEDFLDNPSYVSRLDQVWKKIELAKMKSGKPMVPLIVKVYPVLKEDKTGLSVESGEADTVSAKRFSNMSVISVPRETLATGKVVPIREYPISTDPKYLELLKDIVAKMAKWLDQVDPHRTTVSMVHYFGPGMTSNQMRPVPIEKFAMAGNNIGDIGWSPAGHKQAWKSIADVMASFDALRNRYWIFNFTNLSASVSSRVGLENKDEIEVFKYIESKHPFGASGVLAKSEDLTVNFSSKNFNAGQWRAEFNKSGSLYAFIAGRENLHGWELWSSLSYNRDSRAPFLGPLDKLIENAVYSDLRSAHPNVAQKTVWIELWVDEFLEAHDSDYAPYGSLDEFGKSLSKAIYTGVGCN